MIDLYEAWNKPEKPKNGEQNCPKRKLKESDIALSSGVEKRSN
jgi:hypothetical protein